MLLQEEDSTPQLQLFASRCCQTPHLSFPRSVSVETVRKWLHDLGIDVLQMSKGVFINGNGCLNVVESWKQAVGTLCDGHIKTVFTFVRWGIAFKC